MAPSCATHECAPAYTSRSGVAARLRAARPQLSNVGGSPRVAVRTAAAAVGAATPYVPERKFLEGQPPEVWRYGQPEYSVVNAEYLKNKTKNWEPGSLPDIVESVVKTFEMEISHKTKPEYVQSFAPGFKYSQNGGRLIDGAELLQRGSYNVLINDASYTARNFDFEDSHKEFKSAFPAGFAWEVTEVLAGPPAVTFKWRHWGQFTGPYAGFKETGEQIEMYGMAVATVNDKLQIELLEIFYDPTEFLASLTKGGAISGEAADGAAAAAAAASKCPFAFMHKLFPSQAHK